MNPSRAKIGAARSLGGTMPILALCAFILGIIQLAIIESYALDILDFVFILVFLIYAAAGILAWRRRPSNKVGAIIFLCGIMLYLNAFSHADNYTLNIISYAFSALPVAVTLHLLHAFPSGRLRGKLSQVTVSAAYIAAVVLLVPRFVLEYQPPQGPLFTTNSPDALLTWVQLITALIILILTLVVLIRRIRASTPEHRRILLPVLSYGMLVVLAVSPLGVIAPPAFSVAASETRVIIQLVLIAGVPIVFALGVLRGGFSRVGELYELAQWADTAEGARDDVQHALRGALGDSSAQLLYNVPSGAELVDANGVRVSEHSGRGRVAVEIGGRAIGAIDYNSELVTDRAIVTTAARMVALSVERERLVVDLKAGQKALQRSRLRIVAASDRERSRIAGDLHDGLQAKLLLLALEARKLAKSISQSDVGLEQWKPVVEELERGALELENGIQTTARELRDFVHNIAPAGLIDLGLETAARELLRRMPITTQLDARLSQTPISATTQSTAYFILTEALANVLKYAQANSVVVAIWSDTSWLHLRIHDDGIGGATATGMGLTSIADRVDALTGLFSLSSPSGQGTTLTVELPCGS